MTKDTEPIFELITLELFKRLNLIKEQKSDKSFLLKLMNGKI